MQVSQRDDPTAQQRLWLVVPLSVIFGLWYLLENRRRKRAARLPPGPRPLPLIDNLLDIPSKDQGRAFHDLSMKYGDIVHLSAFGKDIIALDSYDAACDLLEKRSAKYSDRPDFIMGQLTSFTEWSLPTMRYGPVWRAHRRIFHQELLQNTVLEYRDVQLKATHQLLQNLLDTPTRFESHVKRAFASTAMRVGYGLDVESDEDRYIKMLMEALDIGKAISVTGRFLVEVLPVLQRLPMWCPGAGFLRMASESRKRTLGMIDSLYHIGKSNIEKGNFPTSILSSTLQRLEGNGIIDGEVTFDEEQVCAGAAATVYLAGAETTEATILTFILAMANYPAAQAKAQEELDRVVGRSRLPDFSDRESLVYLNALIKEVVRWHVVVPTGLPHTAVEDDEYRGFAIPKGTLILPNIWAFSRDPNIYPDPNNFNPDRFIKNGKLNPDVRNPYNFIFGFGRRICPGRHLADASLFIACASMLHVLKVSALPDDSGGFCAGRPHFTNDTVTSPPEPFECRMQPRFTGAAELVQRTGTHD